LSLISNLFNFASILNYDLKLYISGREKKTLLSNHQFLMWNATFLFSNKIKSIMMRCFRQRALFTFIVLF